jgi:hypothetical protein
VATASDLVDFKNVLYPVVSLKLQLFEIRDALVHPSFKVLGISYLVLLPSLTDVSKFFFGKRIKFFALAYLRFSFRFLL